VVLSAVVLSATGAAFAAPASAPSTATLEVVSLHGTKASTSAIPSGFVIPTTPPWNAYNHWTLDETQTVKLQPGNTTGFLLPIGYGGAATLHTLTAASADLEISVLSATKVSVFRARVNAVPGKRFCPAMFNPYKGGVLGVCFKLTTP